ncbi:MAG: hypothetical protein ACOC2U_02630 [bacterium]
MKNKNPKRKNKNSKWKNLFEYNPLFTFSDKKLPIRTDIKALIYTSKNKHPDEVKIKNYCDDFFSHKNRSYSINFENVMFFKVKKLLFGSTIYLFYHYDNDQPLAISDKLRSLETKRIPNSVLHTALSTDAIKKANDIKSGGLFEDNMVIIGAIIAVGVAMFFIFGG